MKSGNIKCTKAVYCSRTVSEMGTILIDIACFRHVVAFCTFLPSPSFTPFRLFPLAMPILGHLINTFYWHIFAHSCSSSSSHFSINKFLFFFKKKIWQNQVNCSNSILTFKPTIWYICWHIFIQLIKEKKNGIKFTRPLQCAQAIHAPLEFIARS